MKSILSKLSHKRAVSILLGESEVILSRSVLTPFGPTIVDRVSESIEHERVEVVLAKLLEQFKTQRAQRSIPTVVGLSTLRVFFSTRQCNALNRAATPQVQLHEMLKSSTLNIDDMEVDMIRHQPGKNQVAGIVACQKKALVPILDVLKEQGIQPIRVEPAPCALLREAIRRHKSPKKSKLVLRMFLGAESALAVLTANDFPLFWRQSSLTPGREGGSILSLYRCLEKLAGHAGIESMPEIVMIHGRRELGEARVSSDWSETGVPVTLHDEPGYDADRIMDGLALGAYAAGDSFNLARSMTPRVSVWKMLPIGQIAAQAACMAAGGFVLASNLAEVDAGAAAVAAERSALPWLHDQPVAKLNEEKSALTDRLEVIQGFMGGRITWSSALREVSEELTDRMMLTSIEGRCDYRPDSRGREDPKLSKRSLVANVNAPIPKGEAIPREVDKILASLRANPKLKEDLPTVELGTLRWGTSGPHKEATASFSVVCLPKVQAPTAQKKASTGH